MNNVTNPTRATHLPDTFIPTVWWMWFCLVRAKRIPPTVLLWSGPLRPGSLSLLSSGRKHDWNEGMTFQRRFLRMHSLFFARNRSVTATCSFMSIPIKLEQQTTSKDLQVSFGIALDSKTNVFPKHVKVSLAYSWNKYRSSGFPIATHSDC